jgi:sulfate/thiosulfate transport system substrate-binding protein
LEQRKSHEEAVQYLIDLFDHVVVQDDSARKALQTFTGGKGDVMLGYENEAIFAEQNGQAVEHVVPDQTILIENPVAVTKAASAKTQAFVDFLYTEEAQKLFAERGYRPVVESAAGDDQFPTPPSLFTIQDVGGWPDVMKKFFDPEGGIMADVERGIGVSVEKK